MVAMESCASAHYWGRETAEHGHDVKLIAPTCVKSFVKRQKNGATDAEAISGAVWRRTMSFVLVKTAEQQARAVLIRRREPPVRQRTQTINVRRSHLAEYGIAAPQEPSYGWWPPCKRGRSGRR